jgi:diguanylate cyclase (GGDEF)-like protein
VVSTAPASAESSAGPVPFWWLDLRPSRNVVLASAIGLTVLVGTIDYFSGPYLVFSVAYMLPVVVAAWFNGRTSGVIVSLVAGVEGFLVAIADPGVVATSVLAANVGLRVVMFVFVAFVVASTRAAMDALHASASTDPMTGLLNRRRFAEQAQREFARAGRTGHSMALVYVDLDDLKTRNDTEGHEAGDEMLCGFAAAVKREFRETDVLARLGGDEFAMLLPDASLDDGADAVDRLRAVLDGSNGDRPTRFSAGIVAGQASAATELDAVLDAADALMFDAKAAGKNSTRTGPMPGPRSGTMPVP